MSKPSDLVQGTLDLLILKTIELEPKHGWAIGKRIQQISREVLQVQQGSLYPALYRLEEAGKVQAVWEEEPHGRRGARRRIYRLTPKGKRQLAQGREEWVHFVQIIGGIMGAPA